MSVSQHLIVYRSRILADRQTMTLESGANLQTGELASPKSH